MHAKLIRILALITVFFFTWTLGGFAALANAAVAAGKNDRRRNPYLHQKVSPEHRFEEAVDRVEAILADTQMAKKEKQRRLKDRKNEIDILDKEIRKTFAETEAHLKKAGLPDKIMQRHHDFVQQYNDYLDMVQYDLESQESKPGFFRSIGRKFDKARVDKIREKIKQRRARSKKKIRTFDPNNLPFRNRHLKPRPPRLKKEEFQRDLNKNRAKAPAGNSKERAALDTILDYIAPAVEAAPAPPVPEDLAETIEVQFTQDILDKAADLNHDPVKIYNWVHNNIEFVPTWGSIQGAQHCLETRQGNAFDTASLLIALLRASNIPARYVMGTVEIPIAQVMNWVGGFTDPQAALDFIASGGIPVKPILANPNGGINPDQLGAIGGTPVEQNTTDYQIKLAQMEHVWVEAYIDYVPSRGARHKVGQGDTWIEMDASFKQYIYTDGIDIEAAVPFDKQKFAAQLRNSATTDPNGNWVSNIDLELIRTTLDDYKSKLEQYFENTSNELTVGDIYGAKRVIRTQNSFLLGTVPYKLKISGGSYSVIPDAYRHKIYIELSTNDYGDNSIAVEKSLPEIAGKNITIDYIPAEEEDRNLLLSYMPDAPPDGSPIEPDAVPKSIPAYLFRVKPEIKIGNDAHDLIIGNSIKIGTAETLQVQFSEPNIEAQNIFNTVYAGSSMGVAINVGKISKTKINKINENLAQAKERLSSGDFSLLSETDFITDMLCYTAELYHAELNWKSEFISRALKVNAYTLPSLAIFSSEIQLDEMLGIPVSASVGPLMMDADRLLHFSKSLNGDDDKAKAFNLNAGVLSSILEHSVPERIFATDNNNTGGISAIRSLLLANDNNIPIYTIDKNNIDNVLPVISLDSQTVANIKNAVASGMKVITQKTNIEVHGWTGCGYIILDEITNSASYLISGGFSGAIIPVLDTISDIFSFLWKWIYELAPLKGSGYALNIFTDLADVTVSCLKVLGIVGFFIDLLTTITSDSPAEVKVIKMTISLLVFSLSLFLGPLGGLVLAVVGCAIQMAVGEFLDAIYAILKVLLFAARYASNYILPYSNQQVALVS